MLRISCNPSVAHRYGKTNGCPVEFPTAHVLLKSGHKLFRPHSRPRRKFALVAERHQQFYMCAADIDDENFPLHERPLPRIFGRATGRAERSREDAERSSAAVVLPPCW